MRWLSILSTAAMISSAGALAGGTFAAAHVSTTGTVRTNSSLLPSGSTIYGGDVIATGADGLAVVTSRDMGRLEVRPSSRVEFGAAQVTLRDGAVAADKSTVVLDGYTVRSRTPGAAGTWFTVELRNGRKLVAAHRGDVLIARAGAAPLLLPAGFYALAGDSGQSEKAANSKSGQTAANAEGSQNEAEKDDKDKKKDKGGAAEIGKAAGKEAAKEAAKTTGRTAAEGAVKAAGKSAGRKAVEAVAKAAGWTIGSLANPASVAGVTTAAAVAATATTLGVALNDAPVSPAQ